MKSDRKRLKAEKLELLNQMRQLYSTLEEKETELRDFIRNYEQRMKENDETIKQVNIDWFKFHINYSKPSDLSPLLGNIELP